MHMASHSFTDSFAAVSGFARKWMPAISTPLFDMMVSEYPDMDRHLIPERILLIFPSRSFPLISGMTISVMRR